MRRSVRTTTGLLALALALWVVAAATVSAAPNLKSVHYRGVTLTVPRGWPVYRLSPHSATCVRFNRHAVYLGTPGTRQACPVSGAGRTEAILVEPAPQAGVPLPGPDVIVRRTRTLIITATWRTDPGVIRTALGSRLRSAPPAQLRMARRRSAVVSSSSPGSPGSVFTGEGFDTCTTPSTATMAAWGAASPYGAVGVYVGGENMACAQPNLNATWVSTQSAAGWHIMPIYVGLQAPTNSCGCASITPAQAGAEGTAAAEDAVSDAAAIGIGAGNPVYDDMEGYSRDNVNSPAVLAFLEAWTTQLHTEGYLSGIYSSDASGIADLVAEAASGYVEPDDLWIAAWNGQDNTSDATVPAADWANHQRLHQYQGATQETYGGVTIDVDNDAIDGATAAYGAGKVPAPAPVLPTATSPPTVVGVPVLGQTLTELHGTWTGSPSGYSEQWYRCAGSGCAAIPGAVGQTYVVSPADVSERLAVAETAENLAGSSVPAGSTPTPAVAARPGGYWSFTASGVVRNSEYLPLFGSPSAQGLRDFVGMVATPGRLGYWMVTRYATVEGFGDAPRHPAIRVAHPVVGIVRAPALGYWLYTAQGNVYASRGTGFYGSLADRHLTNVSGMAGLPNGAGYWMVTRRGVVYAFGSAPVHRAIHPAHAVIGIVAAPNHGYWLYSAQGDVYASVGAHAYGSPHVPGIASMLATPDGKGYWLVTHAGRVFAYGDAARYPAPASTGGAVIGLAG